MSQQTRVSPPKLSRTEMDTETPTTPQQLPALASRSGRSPLLGKLLRSVGYPLLVFVVAVLLWVLVTRGGFVNRLLVPPPEDVWTALVRGVFGGLWWNHIWITLYEMVAGFLIGVVVGLVIGAVFAFISSLYLAFYPFVIALQSFPKVAIAPLLVVALGYGPEPKIVVAALLAFFPVMTAAIAGFTTIDPDEHRLLVASRASRWQELRYLRLPNAMSYVFPSFDVAVVFALLGAVAAELVGAQAGLGYLLMERQSFGDTASMYATLILLALLGILLRSLTQSIRRLLPRSIVPR